MFFLKYVKINIHKENRFSIIKNYHHKYQISMTHYFFNLIFFSTDIFETCFLRSYFGNIRRHHITTTFVYIIYIRNKLCYSVWPWQLARNIFNDVMIMSHLYSIKKVKNDKTISQINVQNIYIDFIRIT